MSFLVPSSLMKHNSGSHDVSSYPCHFTCHKYCSPTFFLLNIDSTIYSSTTSSSLVGSGSSRIIGTLMGGKLASNCFCKFMKDVFLSSGIDSNKSFDKSEMRE